MKNCAFCHESIDFKKKKKKLSVNFTLQTASEVKEKRLRPFIIVYFLHTKNVLERYQNLISPAQFSVVATLPASQAFLI